MSSRQRMRRIFQMFGLVVLVSVSGSAEAGLFGFGGDSWQEEVLLHDGSKMVITRSQTYGGRHEIGQPSPIKEHAVTFTLPNTDKTISWTSEYGEDIGRTNFHLLAVHVLNGTPYIVAEPNLCLSYNKWGRPNPPYVFFKYDGTAWQRIPLEAFLPEFTTINVALSIIGREVADLVRQGVVSSEQIKKLNRHTVNHDHKTILREPVKLGTEGSAVNCLEMVFHKGVWSGGSDNSVGKYRWIQSSANPSLQKFPVSEKSTGKFVIAVGFSPTCSRERPSHAPFDVSPGIPRI